MDRSAVLEEAVNDITGFLNAQHAALVDVVVELLADPMLWQGQGMTSMPRWLAWRCGVSAATANKIVSIAERADDLPVTLAAFRRGELSLEQAAAVARKAPSWADAQACGYATRMTVHQLQRTMKYPFGDAENDTTAPNVVLNQHDDATAHSNEASTDETASVDPANSATPTTIDEWFSHAFDDDGVFRLSVGTDYESGHIVMAALAEARDALFQNGNVDITWTAALVEIANRSLDSIIEPGRRNRFNINLYVDISSVDTAATDNTDTGQMMNAAGWNVPDAIRRHLTCDGSITPIFLENGTPVSVGRSQRIVPDRTRRVIERRDHGCCAVPGCTRTHGLEVHHIIHWEHDGPTDTWNLLLICRHHHRQHHHHKLGIRGNADHPDGVVFTNQHGHIIDASGAAPNLPTGPPPQPDSPYQHPLGERLDARWLHFNPPRDEASEHARRRQHFLAQQQRRHPDSSPPERHTDHSDHAGQRRAS